MDLIYIVYIIKINYELMKSFILWYCSGVMLA